MKNLAYLLRFAAILVCGYITINILAYIVIPFVFAAVVGFAVVVISRIVKLFS